MQEVKLLLLITWQEVVPLLANKTKSHNTFQLTFNSKICTRYVYQHLVHIKRLRKLYLFRKGSQSFEKDVCFVHFSIAYSNAHAYTSVNTGHRHDFITLQKASKILCMLVKIIWKTITPILATTFVQIFFYVRHLFWHLSQCSGVSVQDGD